MFMISIYDAFLFPSGKIQESEQNCAIFVMTVCGGKLHILFHVPILARNKTLSWHVSLDQNLLHNLFS